MSKKYEKDMLAKFERDSGKLTVEFSFDELLGLICPMRKSAIHE